MKYTLLEIVQNILSSMDSDEVNSIVDTTESEQVANIIRTSYYDLISTRDWAHLRRLCKLDSSTNANMPTHIKFEENVKSFDLINYNNVKLDETRMRYEEIQFIYEDDFLRRASKLNTDEDNVTIVTDISGTQFAVRNDTKPTYYTCFDDDWIVFDSFDSKVDSTIQTSKIQALAYYMPDWVHEDDFVPDLPIGAFSLLISEATSSAHLTLLQVANQKAEQVSVRQNRWLSRQSRRVGQGIRYPNYGRSTRKRGGNRHPFS